MTQDSHNPIDAQDPKKKLKKQKPKGPIRWEAVIPALVLLAILYAYMVLFFDGHLRRLIEIGATYGNGAEVNVRNLKLSFLDASLLIEDVEVTDKTKPTHNLVQLGTLRFNLLTDALLRAKGVVENADILDVMFDAPRKSPGRVLPAKKQEGPSTGSVVKEAAIEHLESRINGTVVGDIAQIIQGGSPQAQLDQLKGELKSVLKAEELQKMLKEKEQAWKKRLEALPKNEALKAYESRFKSIKLDGFKTPDEVQTSVKALDQLYKDIRADVDNVKSTSGAFKSDFSTLTSEVKGFEGMIKNDIEDLKKHFKIPSLDLNSLGQSLFGKLVLSKLNHALQYVDKAKEYMPPPKTPEEIAAEKAAEITPKERALGKNYEFGKPNSYPLFWLKSAKISSKSKPGSFIGDLAGELTNATSSPKQISQPLELKLNGSLPLQKINGITAHLTLDHRTTVPAQSAEIRVASFPVNGQTFSKSEDVTFGFNKADGNAGIKFALRNKVLDFVIGAEAQTIDYLVEAKNSYVADILKGVTADVQRINLESRVHGPLSSLSIDIKSNLGQALQAAFQKQIEVQLQKVEQQIREYVNQQVAIQRARVEEELNKISQQIGVPLNNKEEAVAALQKKIDDAKKQAEENAKNSLKKGIENEVNKFLKGGKLKF